MAAEVPVSDILCEAMEYLSKLGSNLQTRSKNLTERRIRKDKLKNSHAVQKAANKVLLICELSKKSLDNVENGVRKVMSLLEASQAPLNIGGNTSNAKNSNNKHKYYYFKHESRKLRVAKKIPLKHYMSVKVNAKGMSASMLEKYPVYYDCKLKRLRKRIAERHTSKKKRKNSESLSDNEQQSQVSENNDKSAEDIPSDLDQNSMQSNEGDSNSKFFSKSNITDNEASKSDNHCENTEQNKGLNSPKCDSEQHSDNKIVLDQEKILEAATEENTHDEIHTNSNKNNKKKKKGRVRFADIYSDSDIETQKNNRKKSEPMEINLCSDEDNPNSSSIEPKAKKLKFAESDEATNNRLESNDLETAGEVDNFNKDLQSDDNSTDTISQEVSQNDSGAESKPLIRCVNLSKLLKPDILSKKKDFTNVNNNSESTKNSKLSIKNYFGVSNKKEKGSKDNEAEKKQKESDDEYWAQKRKEVSKFKAKKFSIHVEKLPNLNENFLLAHNLKKVTKKGNVICEVLKEKDTLKKVDAVKCALLNDSDSDTCKDKPETNNVKESHFKDSYSKCVHSLKKHNKKSKCYVNKNENERSDTDLIKDTLLKDSDSEKSDGEKEKNDKQMELENTTTSNNQQNEHCANDESHCNNSPSEECDIQSIQIDPKTPSKTNKTSKSALLNDSSDEKSDRNDKDAPNKNSDESDDKSDTNGEKTPTKTKNKTALSLLNSPPDEDFAGFSKEDQVTPTKTIKKVKSALLNNSSDEKQDNSEKETPTKTNKRIKSALLNDSSDEKQDNSEKETPTKTNKRIKSVLLNDSSDEKQNNSEKETPTETNKSIKSALLNDSSDEKQDNTEKETPTETNKSIKSALLNDSSDDKQDNSEKETPTKTNKRIKSALLNDLSDDKQDNSEKETPTKTNERVKSSLLNVSSDDKHNTSQEVTPTKSSQESELEKQNKTDEETPTKTNATIKSALLNDSSEEKSGSNDNVSPTDINKTEKKGQESSDVKSDSSDDNREKRKTPKSKRNYARKSREARKKLKYSSSSESEHEKHRVKRSRKKSQMSGSSSASEHITNKSKAKDFSSNSNNSDNGVSRTIDQVDGADEHSNSSDKMVRSKAKPSGSSSQNSDNQDASDKDIDRLTNLNNLSKNRRGDSTKSREDTDYKKRSSRSKATPTIGEDLLKAESSSDASDDGENEFEELPSVTLPGLNGDSIGRIAQEDLLGESDSSVSHDKEQSENTENMDETDGEQNLKLKRRKAANAISSDSDGASRRRKEAKEERMSDFEDSEDESSEPAKKAKRKKIVSDSDGSVDSNDGKKKRRRIKPVNDSDVSGSDTENEGRNKHGRKNIRKVMGKNQLEEATKKAAREEKERVARIAERQKLYNNLDFDESGKPDEVVLEKVILDFDPETKEPLIQVDRGLVKKLKPHQANGIKFMWDACFESVKRIKKDKGSGCILAHCMGLGKTLQVISLTHTLLTHNSLTGVNRVLVVCPLSTVLNWVNEYKMWLKHAEAEFEVDVYELSRYKQNSERAFQLQQWLDGGGVCVLGYEMFRNLSADNSKKFKKKMLRSFQDSLVDPGPDLVVCDEGHLLKNEKTSLSQSMNRVKTRRRIVLTGTPLQNNLKEYYCMVQFVKPNLLGKYNEYLNRFVNPITNGQYTDSTEHDIRVMKRRSHVLHKMLDGAVQRRDYGVLAPFLPPKHEYVLFITLSDVQIKLYQFYLENYSRRPLPGKSSGFLFPDFQSLQRIWTHPLVLKYNSERYEIMQQKKREREEEDSEGSLVDFIDDDSTPDESSTEESTDDSSDMSDDSRKKSKKKKSAKKGKGKDSKASTRRGTRANPIDLEDVDQQADDIIEVKNENPTEWWIKLVEESEIDDMRNSHKLVLLFDILRQCETIGDKLLVFSQSLYSLDLIEHFLGKVDEATQEGRIDEKLGGHVGSWSPGVDYFRLDGSTSCENRSIWCKNFNREDNPRARLFLISTRAGGLGINLVAANRVVIFDVSWNPSHDVQSIFRVYRFGQKKPCYVYRFLAMGTMEEKIYERQVTKQAISKRVIDEQQIDRHYAENDLAELYKFEARPNEPRPLPTLPKDRLFAEMLREHEAQIYKYHEHDSLLENKEEETLSEEERKAAWEDFENEKNKPPPTVMQAWPMHNGMVPGLLAQQQQQLAYAALAAMLRKDMPNINDNQIRDMLPLIYNSNPGLMQKMSEIYKYAQPGMMNPAMMNPVMNPASGGGAMGGTSSLQYEPPWQRQQQQQQQMRLQQLMQQQNQMGAKFYAGGLGSRDPVAMALQQQRAREIMLGGGGAGGGGGARPRGRPPIHARLPSAAAAATDVVNLDSD